MSKLPIGWSETTLGELADWGSGGTPSRSDPSYYGGSIPWIKSGELNTRYVMVTEEYVTDAALSGSSAKLFPAGSVAIAMYGATIGKTAILGVDASTNQACAVGIPIEGLIEKEFLYRLLQNEKKAFIEKGKGGAQPNISQAVIRAHEVGIPGLAEQTRIVQKLDELLAQVDTLKARIDAIPALLNRFRQSVIDAAVSGRLTSQWRKKNMIGCSATSHQALVNDFAKKLSLREETNFSRGSLTSSYEEKFCWEIPDVWIWSSWGTIADWITYGFTRPMKHREVGTPIVTAKNVRMGFLEFERCHYADDEEYERLSDKDRPRRGDILVTKDGTIGRAALVTDDAPESFCINQSVAVVWLRTTHINGRYLELVVRSERTQRFIQNYAKGMAIPHLSITDFARSPVPVPCAVEQEEIVRVADRLFALADQLEAKIAAAESRINNLTQSILAKAFRGELVPQDPNDEPASELLARIKAQRAAAPKAKRVSKKSAVV